MLQGKGVKKSLDGKVYEGDFEENMIQGSGKMTFRIGN
jgi:hypothetical protein